jgi:hypothetical protein
MMETLIHVMHIVAIKNAHTWSGMSPAQHSMIGFWNLIFVWLKVCPKSRDLQQAPKACLRPQLLLPWLFFRLWALTESLNKK